MKNGWSTSDVVIGAVKNFWMGNGIDLNLCGEGLGQCWKEKTVLCDPPYNEIADWVVQADESLPSEIIMFLPVRTEEQWFQNTVASAVCFWRTEPSMLLYWSKSKVDINNFVNHFAAYGMTANLW